MRSALNSSFISKFVLALVLWAPNAIGAQDAPAIQQLYAFACDGTSCPQGEYPNTLIQSADGNFYGTTASSGTGNSAAGTVFKVTPAGQLSTVYTFVADQNGQFPNGGSPTGLIEGNDGYLYGTAAYGGANSHGIAFRLDKSGDLQVLHSFCALKSCADGTLPLSLSLGRDGSFYGATTAIIGATNGVIFRLSGDGTFSVLHSLASQTEGPSSLGMTQAPNGDFYGTTLGGETLLTTLFRLTPAGQFKILQTFHYAQFADSPPVLDANGKLYGSLSRYEVQSQPGMFESSLSGKRFTQYPLQYDFGDSMIALTATPDTNLWGIIPGANDFPNGAVLSLSEKGKLLQSVSFDGANGADPDAPLVEGSDGTIYGVAASGGTVGGGNTANGVVFALNAGLPAPPPAISRVVPSKGRIGAQVMLNGTHFIGTTAVAFNGVAAPFQLLNTGDILATVPQGATTGLLTVTNMGGSASSKEPFTVK
ncbi:MAG TPA: choice-of-anchor tandem repeat GloVer-containing protein [Rhizomicrobium sp.]|jgi:uncharacterized repeat protein (TIGR03803 family)